MRHDSTRLTRRFAAALRRTALSGAGVLLAALGFACTADRATTLQDREASEAGAVRVRVARARMERLPQMLLYSGSLEPTARITVASKLLARVEAILTDVGQPVRAGQVLVRLDARDLDAAVARAEAAVRMAEVELGSAERQFRRLERLQQRGSASERAYEQAEAAYRLAQARLEEAQAAVAAARVQREYAEVRAPWDGWVVERMVEVGDMAAPGAPLLVIEDIRELKLVFDVPGPELRSLEVDQPVAVEVAGHPPVAARIQRIVPSVDRATRTARVEARVPNQDGTLRPGLFARVRLAGPERQTLRVPASALVREGDLAGIFVVDEAGLARLRWLRLGETQKGFVEVFSGLAEGERYVVEPGWELRDGTPVAAAEETVIEGEDGDGNGSRG